MAMARWAQQMRDGGGGHYTIASEFISEFVSAAIECHPNMDETMTQGMTQS
jgi:hypothetical protein